MRLQLFFLLLLPSYVVCQTPDIHFQDGVSWHSILEKAKAENKYIFVDAYATWCGPCKMMDRDVYTNQKVGEFFNNHFISVKVQMDTAAQDDDHVKSWYADADAIKRQYGIEAFPSYLFFSPEGNLVHRDLGLKNPDQFLALAHIAVDPEKQTYTVYYKLLAEYKAGTASPQQMLQLVNTARTLKENKVAEAVAKEYKENYLDKLSWYELTKEQLNFIGNFHSLVTAEGSKGKYFDMFYKHGVEIDKRIENNGFSNWFVNTIITKEEIEDRIWKHGKPVTGAPNWSRIRSVIANKYGAQYEDLAGYAAQMDFYRRTKNGKEYTSAVDALMKQYPPEAGGKKLSKAIGGLAGYGNDAWGLNVVAWEVFEFSNDKAALERALTWAGLAIELDRQASSKPQPELNSLEHVNLQIVDTKANLLYKLGRVEEAVALEQKAVDIDEAAARKKGRQTYKSGFTKYIQKMKAGIPTWPQTDPI